MILACRVLFAVVVCLCGTYISNAQVIKGKVQDAKNREPLPFANVFLNNTTKGTVTDQKGEFLLKSVHEPGTYELVVSFVGYESYKMKVNLSENEILSTTIALVPLEQELSTVEVSTTRDKAWERQLKKFEKVFLGDDKLADSCKILNPWVIDFVQEKSGKMLAYAAAPIEIENRAMGYQLFFYLNYFWTDRSGYFIAGNVHFSETQSTDEKQILQWQINRKVSYLKSRHNLFKAMVEQRIQGEGFRLYSENNGDENTTVRSVNFSDDLGRSVFPYDTTNIVTVQKDGMYKIALKGKVEVHFHNDRALVRTYRDLRYPVSWIRLNNNHVIVKKDGYEVNPADVIVSGDMSTARVSRMLPVDYKPTNIAVLKDTGGEFLSQFQEKIYVHTDKPYYYPGEPLWFKGYVNYKTPSWRDSLSCTAYVELIGPRKEIMVSKIVRIENGVFDNDFILPAALPKGTYYLRAYSNFNRNFGDHNLFVKPIPVLGETEKADPSQPLSPAAMDSLFTISADKQTYKPREKVTLTLQVTGDDGLPLSANLSVAVTDDQVVPIRESLSIVKAFPYDEKNKQKNLEFKYPIEYGFNFSGRFLNENNKPEMTILNGIQFNPQNLLFTQSDEKGIFSVKGLQFYDTAVFAFKSDKADLKPYGRVELLKREPAAMDFELIDVPVAVLPSKSPKRNVTEYEVPKDARLLKAIEVKGRRIKVEDQDYRVRRPYGKPDYILTQKDLNTSYGNLLQTLPGKVPGLIVRQVANQGEGTKWVVYIQRQMSIAIPAEVLVTINDAIVTGSPAQIIGAIDPNSVESIEVKVGVNVLYGSVGGSGILSIYIKQGLLDEGISKAQNFQQLRVGGYSQAREFNSPDYGDPQTDISESDSRSTIYWNPTVITDAKTGVATISFYAADLEGSYRILAEGVTQNGEPVRSEYFITVEK